MDVVYPFAALKENMQRPLRPAQPAPGRHDFEIKSLSAKMSGNIMGQGIGRVVENGNDHSAPQRTLRPPREPKNTLQSRR